MQTELIKQITQTNIEAVRSSYEKEREELLNRQVYKELSAYNKDLAMAFVGPKLKEYNFSFLKDLIELIVIDTHQSCNESIDQSMLDDTMEELTDDLQKYSGTMTLEEVKIFFKNGWKHEYGRVFKLSNSQYLKWRNEFMVNEDRIRIRKMVQKRESIDKPMLTIKQKQDILINGILQNYNDYKRGGRGYLVTTTVAYDFFKSIGLINLSKEQHARVVQFVKKQIAEEAIEDKKNSTKINKSVKAVVASIEGDKVILYGKRRAVEEYFINCKGMDLDLKQEIEAALEGANNGIC